ncbi:Uncharacterised protein [uncultured archaeon]|nr:Uncharacterised protein [uncultured archaeon]
MRKMKELQLYSLNQIRDKYGDKKLREIIDNFGLESVKRKIDCVNAETVKKIEYFVKSELETSNDITNDRRVASHFVLDQNDKFLGFFSHYIKKLRLPNETNICNSKEVFYITCLARDDGVTKDELDMKDILDFAFGIFYSIKELTGGIDTVIVETDSEKLRNSYIKYGFSDIYNHDNDLFLLQMELS